MTTEFERVNHRYTKTTDGRLWISRVPTDAGFDVYDILDGGPGGELLDVRESLEAAMDSARRLIPHMGATA
jgi:hypothetical protein